MIGLDVCVEHRDDGRTLAFGEPDVVVDQVDMRIDDREGAVRLASEQIRGTGGRVVQQLSEIHAGPPGLALIALESYQLIS